MRTRLAGGIVALIALAAVTVISLWAVNPPAPRDASAPPDAFSAARAFSHVERVGARVHVAGSPAATDVREYIASTMRGLGLRTEVMDGVGATDALGGYAMARVSNVVAVLPGTNPTGRVFLVAHYDSVQVSYGGNDDGAGVATLLETARALTSGPKPRNDIVFVFTDAEEACLCGAEAFVRQHSLASDGGVVLNFEARGSSGPVVMFETSRGNADVVRVYGDSVPYPAATSFAVEVYRILPNDTDFTPFREEERFTGLNQAYIDGSNPYHSPEDRPSYMDKGSLQMHGDNALAMVRAFGDGDLTTLATRSSGDATYFPVFRQLIRYPGWLVWPIAALALIAVALLAWLARRKELITWGRLASGFGLALIPLLFGAVLAQVLWLLLVAIRPGYTDMLDPWRPGWFRLGVVALVATVLLLWYALFRRRFGAWALALGGLAWLAVLGLVLAAFTPGGSYLAAIPALAMAVAGLVALRLSSMLGQLAAFTIGGAVAVVILAPTVLLFFPALGLQTGGAAAFFATMLGLALLPVLEYVFVDSRRLWTFIPGLTAAVLAIACVAIGLSVDRFDADHPAPTQLMYALDADSGQAKWISAESAPSEWTRQYVSGTENLKDSFPVFGDEDLATGNAQAATLPAPVVRTLSDQTAGGQRTVLLSIEPQRDVRLIYVKVLGETKVVAANAEGRDVAIDPESKDPFSLLFHAPADAGMTLRLTVASSGPFQLRVMDGSDGLDRLPGFKPRPPGVGIEGSHDSELAVVAKNVVV